MGEPADGPGGAVDLDAAAPPPVDRAPARAPAGRRARLVVWLLLAALVGAGLGSAVTTRRAAVVADEAAAADRARPRAGARADAGERAVLALQAGAPLLLSGVTEADPRGRSTLTLGVPVSNRGAEALVVTISGLDVLGGPRLAVAAGGAQVFVAPGTTASASVVLVVRCEDVLSSAVDGGAPASALRVSVDAPGGLRRAALALPDSYLGTVAGLVSSACRPPLDRRAPVEATWAQRPDGALEVTVVDPYASEPLVVDVDRSRGPGLGLRSDGPLPAGSAADQAAGASVRTVTLVLRMEPTCSEVAPPGQVPTARFDVVTAAGGRVQAVVPDDDGVKAAWTARQIALRCG